MGFYYLCFHFFSCTVIVNVHYALIVLSLKHVIFMRAIPLLLAFRQIWVCLGSPGL